MFNEVIYLSAKKSTTNKIGDQIETEEQVLRLAKIKGIGQTEFYQAQAQGLKPEIKFVLPDYLDYNNQEEVIYNGFRYKILRTFRTGTELEIVCYGGVRMEVAANGNS